MLSSVLRMFGVASLAAVVLCGPSPIAAHAAAMDFETLDLSPGGRCKARRCPIVMVAAGEITPGTTQRFITFVQQAARQGANDVLIIDSPGGRLVESLNLGLVLRKLRTSVFVGRAVTSNGENFVVNGSCMSACVYMLMGGARRFVTVESRLGVHREFLPNSSGSDPLSVLRSTQRFPEASMMLRAYSRRMGVSPALIDLAEQYGVGGIRILTPQDIVRFRLAKIAK